MKKLTKKEKIDFIQKMVKLHGISMYKIAKETGITQSGIKRIIDGTTQNPGMNNVNMIFDLLNKLFNQDNDADRKKTVIDSDFDNMLNAAIDARIRVIIEQETGKKFKEINETLLMLLKRSFDRQTDAITDSDHPGFEMEK